MRNTYKVEDIDMNLDDYLKYVLDNYLTAKKQPIKGNSVAKTIRVIALKVIPAYILHSEKIVKGSVGQGNWAEVPWLAIMNESVTSSATQGYYIVYLFASDGSGVYLSLNQGYTYYTDKYKKKSPKAKVKIVSDYWRNNLVSLDDNKPFSIDPINLKSSNTGGLPEGYELGNICSKWYSRTELDNIDNTELISDLTKLNVIYDELVNKLEGNFAKKNESIIYEKMNNADETLIESTVEGNDSLPEVVSVPKNVRIQSDKKGAGQTSKVDHVAKHVEQVAIGKKGEEIVLKFEQERLKSDERLQNKVSDIKHVSKEKGDGDGYDIESFMVDENTNEIKPLYIEVKSTTSNLTTPFIMSKNEIDVSETYGESYVIYRLYIGEVKNKLYKIFNPFIRTDRMAIQFKVWPK